jgi:hypothetical protein
MKFTIRELDHALKFCKDSSPGPDDVHDLMIKELQQLAEMKLLDIYNQLWITYVFPERTLTTSISGLT